MAESKKYKIPINFDPQLSKDGEINIENISESALRKAFVLLEERIRRAIDAQKDLHGHRLIEKAFHPDKGVLQDPSMPGAERQGLYKFIDGVMLTVRNPLAHRLHVTTADSLREALIMVNRALKLTSKLVERKYQIGNYVSPHEGEIKHSNLFLRDIDNDGVKEVVVLLIMECVTENENDSDKRYYYPLILKEQEDGKGYKRLLSTRVSGQAVFPEALRLRYIFNNEVPEIITYWGYPTSGSEVIIYTKEGDTYKALGRKEGDHFTHRFIATHWGFRFLDFDGDGLEEVIEFDYPDLQTQKSIYRLWDWNETEGHFELIEDPHVEIVE